MFKFGGGKSKLSKEDQLHAAIENNNFNAFQKLLNQGQPLRLESMLSGMTCLHSSVVKGQCKMAEMLLDKQADIECCDEQLHQTPVMIASEQGDHQMLHLLLERNANAKAINAIGRSPLHRAARRGHTECVAELIQHKADVNARDFMGKTALHYAAEVDQPIVAKMLLENKADFRILNNEGRNPLETCRRHENWAGQHATTDLLETQSAAGAPAPSRGTVRGRAKKVRSRTNSESA